MRKPDCFSTPFMRLTAIVPGSITRAAALRFSRSTWLGTQKYTSSAPLKACARTLVACRLRGRLMPGR